MRHVEGDRETLQAVNIDTGLSRRPAVRSPQRPTRGPTRVPGKPTRKPTRVPPQGCAKLTEFDWIFDCDCDFLIKFRFWCWF